MQIIGTDHRPEPFPDGHTESHLKILKLDANFMDAHERRKIEEEYLKEFHTGSKWRKSFLEALNGGQLKSVNNGDAWDSLKMKRRNAVIGESKRNFVPRAKWHMAIFKVIYGIRAAKSNTIIDTVFDKSLVSQLHEFQSRSDTMTLKKIKHVLDVPSFYRTDEELGFLNRVMLARVKSFSKFSPEQRIQFCRVMSFEKHDAGKMIIRQGDPPWNFYFLFSGQCDVVKKRTDGNEGVVRVHVLNSGDSFGAVALEALVQETRTATVVCSAECSFLVIDKGKFID